jgi:hypothetical protein
LIDNDLNDVEKVKFMRFIRNLSTKKGWLRGTKKTSTTHKTRNQPLRKDIFLWVDTTYYNIFLNNFKH